MSTALIVRAAIVDLRADSPQATDRFYVDTNVWCWTVYPRARLRTVAPRRYQLREYPRYVRNTIRSGADLHHLGLSLGELAHVIEGAELDMFQQTGQARHRKDFRYNFPADRANVTRRIAVAWREIEHMSRLIDVLIDDEFVGNALQRLRSELLDGYDALVVERLAQVGIDQVITDDADFATVAGLTVFTSNLAVLNAAQAQGRLAVR